LRIKKGGVGKTTTAINLSAALAHRGKRTLLIDLDPQANSTIAFYDSGEISTSMFDVLSDSRVTLSSVIKPTKDALLFLGPGRLALAKLEQVLAGQFDAPFKLKDALTPVLKDYDYIILDTPPSLGILTVMRWWPRRICWCPSRRRISRSKERTIYSRLTSGSAHVPTQG